MTKAIVMKWLTKKGWTRIGDDDFEMDNGITVYHLSFVRNIMRIEYQDPDGTWQLYDYYNLDLDKSQVIKNMLTSI